MKRGSALPMILVVEDNLGDVDLLKTLFSMVKVPCELCFVSDGVDAMDYLLRRGTYSAARSPDLILLDLNLPRKNGRELLKEIKAQPTLRHLPVIIFSTSNSQTDVYDLYTMGATGFITKPVDIERLAKIITAISDFWLGAVELPTPPTTIPGLRMGA
jgi:two-component system, chemotaxis family, response regulator Rcp1